MYNLCIGPNCTLRVEAKCLVAATEDDYRPTSFQSSMDGSLSSFLNQREVKKNADRLLILWATNPDDPASRKEGYDFRLGSFVKVRKPLSPWHNTVGKIIGFS